METLPQITPKEFIEEHERLEEVLKANSYSRKKELTDKVQFKNRLLDLFEIALLNSETNQKLTTAILTKTPQIINKVCLSAKYNYLNTERVISAVRKLLESLSVESLLSNRKQVGEILATIFNIMVYKKSKQNLKPLLAIITKLVKTDNSELRKVVVKNLDILMNFIQRGKNIDKILFSFEKILDGSEEIFLLKFEELLNVLAKTKNRFFIEHFIGYCGGYFGNKKLGDKKDFKEILNRHVLSLYENLKEVGFLGEEAGKKGKRVITGFKKFLQGLEGGEKEEFGNIKLTLNKLSN